MHCAACDTWSQAGESEGGSPPCIAEHLRRFNCPACGAELLPRGPGLMCFQLDPQADFNGDRALRTAQPFPPLASFDIGGGAFSQLQPSQPAVCIPLATAVAPAAPGRRAAGALACQRGTSRQAARSSSLLEKSAPAVGAVLPVAFRSGGSVLMGDDRRRSGPRYRRGRPSSGRFGGEKRTRHEYPADLIVVKSFKNFVQKSFRSLNLLKPSGLLFAIYPYRYS